MSVKEIARYGVIENTIEGYLNVDLAREELCLSRRQVFRLKRELKEKGIEEEYHLGEYRFVHRYSFDKSTEFHVFTLTGQKGYYAIDFRFVHSYGLLDIESLWEFENWMTEMPEKPYPLKERPIELRMNWKGRLPYPEGEETKGTIPNIEADWIN